MKEYKIGDKSVWIAYDGHSKKYKIEVRKGVEVVGEMECSKKQGERIIEFLELLGVEKIWDF
ncbi:hypothetical protein [Methanotorris igneus]|uniref:Uncharacterized protein n=1 Tax=Methanotorris igneus (strain DSM 5666 / JCM 11834 / Kol 5) TaxID=880724 RepID=F6BBZ1_METIK|nr:hypothetical protein [Methanotorris igneus]AEF96072.1 hypothetical protein Metig_0516 [Methanotorris igneus Kol 5]